jgi:hypothetical protein
MNKLPISLVLMTSTKGHYGVRDMYAWTLTSIDRQIPLDQFGCLYAHIKASTGDEEVTAKMEANLKALGFIVEVTKGDWSRGTSHQQAYLEDLRRASVHPAVQSQPYILLNEDDSTMDVHGGDLVHVLHRMITFLHVNPDIVSTRFLRRGDFCTSPILEQEADYFYSPHYNLQPSILRSRDFFIANRLIEAGWSQISHLQCELILRLALNQLTRSEFAHIVWLPDYAETIHLGVPDHENVRKTLNL